MPGTATLVRYRAGVPACRYPTAPQTPPVSVLRFGPHALPGGGQRHIHDFPVLVYTERARQALSDGPPGQAQAGDACVLALGAVIDPAMLAPAAAGFGVFFDPAALGGEGQAPQPSWRSHPLLLPFQHQMPGGLLRLHVPPARQPAWTATIAAIETELAGRAEGHQHAALAYLTLLLVDVARLAAEVTSGLRRSNDPLLTEVFDIIEQRYAGPLSLRDVADTIGMTPGYLTTLVRQRTGRTVMDWITEQRMTQARRFLTDTDLPVSQIARRVGLPDPGYFARVFRYANGMTPRDWRRNAARTITPAPD